MQIEEWKDIPYAPGYKISEYGNLTSKNGKKYKSLPNPNGYLYVRIHKFGIRTTVHNMVARLWLGENPGGLQINHKDGNKRNNHYSNLEYVSCKENINHSIRLGLRPSRCMFTKAQVIAIKDALREGFRNSEINKYFNCSHATISRIQHGKIYTHIL